MEWMNQLGAGATIALGLLGLLFPRQAARMVSLIPEGREGLAEIRATLGGLFLALGITCFATASETAFMVTGLAWVGAACGRLISIAVDRGWSLKNGGGLVIEGGIGALCLL